MQRLAFKLSNRPGFTLILSALLIMVFLGAAVMAVDVGHMRVLRADVHSAADAAALAGIEKYIGVSDASAALAEAQLYAGKFRADAHALSLASSDFKLGAWDSITARTCNPLPSCAFTAGGSPTNAAQATVRDTGSYVFAKALYGGISQHVAAATSIAVGVDNKSVTRSSCVSPGLLSFGALQAQLGTTDDPLTAADIARLSSASNPVTFSIPNGVKVSGVDNGDFVQINLPPTLTAAGAPQDPGPPSASGYRSAFSCTSADRNAYVGLGDWVQPVNGQMSNSTAMGIQAIEGQPMEVLLASTFSTPAGCPSGSGSSALKGCFQVKYIASFVVTAVGSKSISGYFTAISVPSGTAITTTTAPGPVELVTKIKLVY